MTRQPTTPCAGLVAGLLIVACGGRDSSAPPPGAVFRVIYGIDTANTLIRFSNTAPGAITRAVSISGLQAGEAVLGIDFRPADGNLYALGSSSRLYTLDTVSGAATAVGAGSFTPSLDGTRFGFDVNPVEDVLRLQSDTRQNVHLDPASGVAGADMPVSNDTDDVNSGTPPVLVGTAYTNSVTPAPTETVPYAINAATGALVRLLAPGDGLSSTVGSLGVATSGYVGFDIVGPDNRAYATLTPPAGGPSRLYFVSLRTGHATQIGTVGGGAVLRGIAVAP